MEKAKCERCGYQWTPRREDWKACPYCKAYKKIEKKESRINQFFKNLRDGGLSDYDIAAGLGNGDIKRPEWLSISESTDHLKAWDNETDACSQWGFVTISYDN